MKKLISMLLILVMTLSLVACANKTPTNQVQPTDESTTSIEETQVTFVPSNTEELLFNLYASGITNNNVAIWKIENDNKEMLSKYIGISSIENMAEISIMTGSDPNLPLCIALISANSVDAVNQISATVQTSIATKEGGSSNTINVTTLENYILAVVIDPHVVTDCTADKIADIFLQLMKNGGAVIDSTEPSIPSETIPDETVPVATVPDDTIANDDTAENSTVSTESTDTEEQ